MFQRPPGPRAPTGRPRAGEPRRAVPLLPRLTVPGQRAPRGAGGSAWWPEREPEPRGAGGPAMRLPALLTGAPRAAPGRGALGRLLLPPLLAAGVGAARRPRRGQARDAPDAPGEVLEELLPRRFRDFVRQLRAKSGEPPREPLARQHLLSESKHWPRSQCPHGSFLPDLWDKSSYLHDWGENLLHQKPSLWSPRSDHSQFTTVKKSNQFNRTQTPKVKAVLNQTPSGEGPRPRRRNCPFRVRFADETVQDTAFRYWERNRAVRQNFFRTEQTTLPAVSVSERVLGSVGRWLDSLPQTLHPRVQKPASSSCWDYPYLSPREPQVYRSEDASRRSSLPFIPRATTPRYQPGLKTYLDGCSKMEPQVGKSPSSWTKKLVSFLPSLVLQSILKGDHPRGY